jgi:hypothetical protein
VRFSADACLPSTPAATNKPSSRSATTNPDDLASSLAGLSIKPATQASPSAGSSELRIIRGGREVPQSALVELTTRSTNNILNLNWLEIYPQLYLSQTPHFYIGVHARGGFFEIQKRHLDDSELAQHRKDAKANLQRLGKALEVIQEIAIEHGDSRRLCLMCEKGILNVYERLGNDNCLSEETLERFSS